MFVFRMKASNMAVIFSNSKAFFSFNLASRWLAIRLDSVSILVVVGVGLFGVFLRSSLDPVLVGLGVVYALTLTGFLQWSVRLFVETENNLTVNPDLPLPRTDPCPLLVDSGCRAPVDLPRSAL